MLKNNEISPGAEIVPSEINKTARNAFILGGIALPISITFGIVVKESIIQPSNITEAYIEAGLIGLIGLVSVSIGATEYRRARKIEPTNKDFTST